MPTFDAHERFWQEYRHLRPEQQVLFKQALHSFIQALQTWERERHSGSPRFPAQLGVTPMVNHTNILEFRWAPDGRCTWEYGTRRQGRGFHIIWRRIGTHSIYDEP